MLAPEQLTASRRSMDVLLLGAACGARASRSRHCTRSVSQVIRVLPTFESGEPDKGSPAVALLLSCYGLPGLRPERVVERRSCERVEVVADRLQADAHEYLAQLILRESTSEKIVDRARGHVTTHAHDDAREAHERVDPRIRYRFKVANSPNDGFRRAKHPRNGRMCGHAVLAVIFGAHGDEHRLPLERRETALAVGCVQSEVAGEECG